MLLPADVFLILPSFLLSFLLSQTEEDEQRQGKNKLGVTVSTANVGARDVYQTAMSQVGAADNKNIMGRDIVADMDVKDRGEGEEEYDAYTHFGRPDYDKIFKDAVEKHRGEKIGVFYCGPHVVEQILSKSCRENQDIHGTDGAKTFLRFHAENF